MINIQDIVPFMKKGWVAMDEDGHWYWYEKKPKIMDKTKGVWEATSNIWLELDFSAFETIAPADDWTKSLQKVGGK